MLFEGCVKECFAVQKNLGPIKAQARSLLFDEQNILQYACGFVSMHLICHFRKQHGDKAAYFVECFSHMAVNSPESSFLDYTREWMKVVS